MKKRLDALKDERHRPALPRAPLPHDVMDFEPEVPFQLDEKLFGKNFRSLRGMAGGPSGMTSDHLRPLLSDFRGMKLLFQLGEPLQRTHPFNGCGSPTEECEASWPEMWSGDWLQGPYRRRGAHHSPRGGRGTG